jgi:hypothetical protein
VQDFPESILELILFHAENKITFAKLCRSCYTLYSSPTVRARYLLRQFDPEDVFSEKSARRLGCIYGPEVIEALRLNNPLVSVKQNNYFLFRWAAEAGKLELLKWLVDDLKQPEKHAQVRRASLTSRHSEDVSESEHVNIKKEMEMAELQGILNVALLEACRQGYTEIVMWLVETQQVDINNRSGLALTYAIQHKHIVIVSYLLDIGVQLNPAHNQLLLSSFRGLVSQATTQLDTKIVAIFEGLLENGGGREESTWAVIEHMVRWQPKWKGLAMGYASAQGLTHVMERLKQLGQPQPDLID